MDLDFSKLTELVPDGQNKVTGILTFPLSTRRATVTVSRVIKGWEARLVIVVDTHTFHDDVPSREDRDAFTGLLERAHLEASERRDRDRAACLDAVKKVGLFTN